jgi:hypothetical protein
LAEDAIQLPRLGPAGQRTVLLLGRGASLNVAFAGSLVLYWLAGMA